jgi:serine/threonine protein kinase
LILREEDGKICLVDFGSVQAQFEVGRTMTVVGTYGYMAPEQFTGLSSSVSDLYGLGATMLFALSGKDPADWPRRGPYIDLRTIPDESLRIWLGKMVNPDPACRFVTAKNALVNLLHPSEPEIASEALVPDESRLRISLRLNHYQIEIKSKNPWSIFNSFSSPIIKRILIAGGFWVVFCAVFKEVTYPLPLGIVIVLPGLSKLLFLAPQYIPWQWQIVANPKHKLLLRTLFGKVIQRYTLPISLQVATAEEEMSGKKPPKFSVALVTPEGRRYLLGSWYNKLESQQLASFLREWLEKNN